MNTMAKKILKTCPKRDETFHARTYRSKDIKQQSYLKLPSQCFLQTKTISLEW